MTGFLVPGLPLPRAFYEQPTVDAARALLGHTLLRRLPGGDSLAGIVVETEAYGDDDPALWAYQTPTPRNQVMFGPPGHAYLYAAYRVHLMLNIVCAPPGTAQSVLIRAIQPTNGLPQMRVHRGNVPDDHQLTNGPGKLSAALGLSVEEFNGVDVTDPNSPLQLVARDYSLLEIVATTRIGLSRGVDLPRRFTIHGSPYVSRPVPRAAH